MQLFKLLFYTFTSFIFIGCGYDSSINGNGTITKYIESDFVSEKLIASTIDSISSNLIDPGYIHFVNEYMLILDRKSEASFHLIDTDKNKYIGMYGKKGEGPGEVITPWSFSNYKKKSFLLFDITTRKIIGYDIDSLINNKSFEFEHKFNHNIGLVEYYNDNLFYSDIFNEKNCRLYKRKITAKEIETEGFGVIPTLTKESESNFVKALAADAIMKSNNGNFVFVYKLCPRIEIFNSENIWQTIIAPKHFEIDYGVISNEGLDFFAATKSTLTGYIDVALTDKYIYALFGKGNFFDEVTSTSNAIYVFDYNGVPQKKFIIDENISSIAVKNDSVIYAIHQDVIPSILQFKIQ